MDAGGRASLRRCSAVPPARAAARAGVVGTIETGSGPVSRQRVGPRQWPRAAVLDQGSRLAYCDWPTHCSRTYLAPQAAAVALMLTDDRRSNRNHRVGACL